jgi:hypothetical protein
MADERTDFQRLGDLAFETWGRLTGLEMMLRTLYAKWALEHADPDAFLEQTHRELLDGMARVGRDDDPVEALLIHHAENQIEDTIGNVRRRVGQATPGQP